MPRSLLAVAWTCCALLAGAAVAASDSEPALRAELMAATWPAEVVRLAADYRRRYPNGPGAADASARAQRAARAQQALESKDVNLSRNSVAAAAGHPSLRADAERAMQADAEAATRVALALREGEAAAANPVIPLEWLHYAAALDSPQANYELSRHYRQQDQMPQAARYQARAVELGFVLPRELDHVRK